MNVLDASKERISFIFDEFENVCCSFSAGKDSGVMTHLVLEEARKRSRKVVLMFIDWECQFTRTIHFAETIYNEYSDCIIPYWIQIPIKTWNSCSVFEPEWKCWDENKNWVREKREGCISDGKHFPFWYDGIMFEEFVPMFAEWFFKGQKAAVFVGIRTQESLNRYRTIAREKPRYNGLRWTTCISKNVWNAYPIYDWKVTDIWTYNGKFKKSYNSLYDIMHKSGMTLSQMRICEPFGDEARKGLYLFQLVEPDLWCKLLLRVEGANMGKLYASKRGTVMGNNTISLPNGHTWESFAKKILSTMPKKTSNHYKNKITVYLKWWGNHGYEYGVIPDESDPKMEANGKAPSWRRIAKTLLRNDYWCKGLGFSPTKTRAYDKYLELMKRRKEQWGEVV